MSDSVQMPALGESVTEGTVTRWLKQVGEHVDVDEPLLEVSTDKVDTEIPSPVAGVIQEILVAEDETVAVGTALALIGDGSGGGAGGGGAEQRIGSGGAAPHRARRRPGAGRVDGAHPGRRRAAGPALVHGGRGAGRAAAARRTAGRGRAARADARPGRVGDRGHRDPLAQARGRHRGGRRAVARGVHRQGRHGDPVAGRGGRPPDPGRARTRPSPWVPTSSWSGRRRAGSAGSSRPTAAEQAPSSRRSSHQQQFQQQSPPAPRPAPAAAPPAPPAPPRQAAARATGTARAARPGCSRPRGAGLRDRRLRADADGSSYAEYPAANPAPAGNGQQSPAQAQSAQARGPPRRPGSTRTAAARPLMYVTPLVRRLAAEHDVDLSSVTGHRRRRPDAQAGRARRREGQAGRPAGAAAARPRRRPPLRPRLPPPAPRPTRPACAARR